MKLNDKQAAHVWEGFCIAQHLCGILNCTIGDLPFIAKVWLEREQEAEKMKQRIFDLEKANAILRQEEWVA